VKKFEKLEETTAPDGSVLTLFRHDGDYFIRVAGVELMSTRRHASEELLADLVCAPLRTVTGARVLIGGLGFGFTLRAALRNLADDAEVIVVELLGSIVDWNENPSYALAGAAQRDPRVEVRTADVARVIASSPGSYDAIMLDVDNGADALTTNGNSQLYHDHGIHLAAAALRPGGELAYWSSNADPSFAASLRRCRLDVRTTQARAHATGGARHFIYTASEAGRDGR
jgi:spermidine synthase